jgi:hypothetical protein
MTLRKSKHLEVYLTDIYTWAHHCNMCSCVLDSANRYTPIRILADSEDAREDFRDWLLVHDRMDQKDPATTANIQKLCYAILEGFV